ncbi:hypothetical protein D3C85_1355080 [compost metagenome]
MVDQKAGRIRGHRDEVPGLFGQRRQPLDHLRLGTFTAHHLDDLHQGDRVEEVKAGHPLGMLAGAGDLGNRQGRRVAGQHSVMADQLFQLAEQALLGLEILDNGLDQQVAAGQIL